LRARRTRRRLRVVRRATPAATPNLVQRSLQRCVLDESLVVAGSDGGEAPRPLSLRALRPYAAEAAVARALCE
jgi:hypothetical protein